MFQPNETNRPATLKECLESRIDDIFTRLSLAIGDIATWIDGRDRRRNNIHNQR